MNSTEFQLLAGEPISWSGWLELSSWDADDMSPSYLLLYLEYAQEQQDILIEMNPQK